MPVDLWLAQNELEELKIGLVLDVNVDGLLAAATLLEAVVLLLELSDDARVSPTALNAHVDVLTRLPCRRQRLVSLFSFFHRCSFVIGFFVVIVGVQLFCQPSRKLHDLDWLLVFSCIDARFDAPIEGFDC